MKSIKYFFTYFFCLAFTSLMFHGCTDDFAELNTNPNDPTDVAPQVIFPYGVRESIDRTHGHQTRLERLGLDGGMLWVQYFARNQYTNEGDTYNPDASMRNANWEGFFTEGAINFQKVIEISSNTESPYANENYAAIGLIMREYIFSIITDTWGAVPYVEALDGSAGNLAPAYSSQEDIYSGILSNLKIASDMLDPSGSSVKGDILFGGDIIKWKKFANSLRLRLANRQSTKKPAESAAIFTEIMGDPVIYPIFESNEDMAVLNYESRPSNNPWNDIMVQSGREDWSISQTLINMMTDGVGTPTDPRITIYAQPAIAGDLEGMYAGAENGLPEALASIYINTASRPGAFFTSEKAPFYLMTYSELLFVLAEASLSGLYTEGLTAKEYLDMAINASFNQYDLEVPIDYLGSKEANKEIIMTEKWKALFSQGIEAWTEYRRTGFPTLTAASPNAIFENEGQVPTRLRYPESEYSLNAANVAEGVKLNEGPDNKLTKMWWAE